MKCRTRTVGARNHLGRSILWYKGFPNLVDTNDLESACERISSAEVQLAKGHEQTHHGYRRTRTCPRRRSQGFSALSLDCHAGSGTKQEAISPHDLGESMRSFMAVQSSSQPKESCWWQQCEKRRGISTYPVRGPPYISSFSPIMPPSRTTSRDIPSGLLWTFVEFDVHPKDEELIVEVAREP